MLNQFTEKVESFASARCLVAMRQCFSKAIDAPLSYKRNPIALPDIQEKYFLHARIVVIASGARRYTQVM